ncbi:MAG: hypothetical protein K6G16_08730 [Lachnospiraceae bacterium]|nr:hypothetical protein [Lachnospiraceae bacterium]
MNTTKNRIPKAKTPETIQVIVPAESLLDVMRRYKKVTWPVTVTIRDRRRGGTLFFLRNRGELEAFRKQAEGLQVAYFGKVRDELMVDLGKDAKVTVNYKSFRKARSAGLLTPSEAVRYFLYRTGDMKEAWKEKATKPASAVRL